jgi:hypothetical protein
VLGAQQLNKGLDFTSSICDIMLLFVRFAAFFQRFEGLNSLVMNVFFFYYTIPQ